MDSLSPDVLKETRRLNNIPEGDSIGAHSVRILSLFFNPLPPDKSLTLFTNLVELVFIGQQVKNLSFVKYCPKLKKLWVCEGGLKSMRGIRRAERLEELVLFDNNISQLEDLDSMTSLRRLWINDNGIVTLTEINNLTNTIDLNLAGNKIFRLNNALISLPNLETLNISGNLLYDLQDILLLSNLPKLKVLTLNDPEYLPSVVTLQPHTLLALSYQIPQLDSIDGIRLDKPFRSLIDSIICDKKLFFYSISRHRHNQLLKCKRDLDKLRNELSNDILEQIRMLDLQAKSSESYIERAKITEKIMLKRLLESVQDRITFWKNRLEDIKFEFGLSASCNLNRCLYTAELQMFGCLSVDPIYKSSALFNLCENFLQTRVCWHDKSFESFSKMRLKNIWHIRNTLLNEHRRSIQSEDDDLFLYNRFFSTDDDFCHLGEILRCGFSNERVAGHFRFTSLLNKLLPPDKLATGRLCNISFIILVVRGVKREKDNCSKTEIILPSANSFLSNGTRKFCACSLVHFEFDFNNCDAIIPEFITEIQLISKSAVNQTSRNLNSSVDFAQDFEDLMSIPHLQFPPDLSKYNTAEDLRHSWFSSTDPNKFGSVTKLNLFGTGFRSFQILKELTSLTSLSLSNCELRDLEGLSLNFLETLDVSHNSISTFRGLGYCPSLHSLNANWNLLSNLQEEVENLLCVTKKLVTIQLELNPWICCRISDEYALNLFSLLVCDAKSKDEILANSKEIFRRSHIFSKSTKNMLSLWPVTKTLYRGCSNNMHNLDFFMKTTQFWSRLNPINSEVFQSLRVLYLNCVNLTDLKFLNGLEQLEELSIESNGLTSLQGIGDFKNLQILLAGDNFIKTIANLGFKGLKNLKVLALDSNELSSITHLKHCHSLQQIYISGNNITDYQSVLALQNMPDLKVLDMRFNPIKLNLSKHRLRTIYHLPQLHFLDGKPVNSNELKEAKAYFDGRLTTEFLLASLDIKTPEGLSHFNIENKNIRSIELTPVEIFSNLRTVNLQNNNLTSFEGLLELKNLEILWLTGNKISSFRALDRKATYLPKLSVLSLERNGIKSLIGLHLNRLPSIETLFLQDNALTNISGLAGLVNLRYLILDRNRIHKIHPKEFSSLSKLIELHLDDNRLRDIPPMEKLEGLEHFYLSANRLGKLECVLNNLKLLSKLSQLSLYDNPLSKVTHYRLIVLKHLPNLQSLDGIRYNLGEKAIAKLLFEENNDSEDYGDNFYSQNKPLWQSSIIERNQSTLETNSSGSLGVKSHQLNLNFPSIPSSASRPVDFNSQAFTSNPLKTQVTENIGKSKIVPKPYTKRVVMVLPGISINAMAQFGTQESNVNKNS
ncbi:unnamed protein product [Hymenolepis diminuta]|uniref:Protein phosphatase 1 regulatory subunit 7 n=1 Tax=Hymenolepis diminuta TaxID=6216 RepID=A0A564Y7E9_HYMDI|nr:unnamed protein product [Hymenolepis diminuta]